ncbi:MAG: LysM peptidoglycan-binding domain-containing protein [Acidimicrobiales bacterium]
MLIVLRHRPTGLCMFRQSLASAAAALCLSLVWVSPASADTSLVVKSGDTLSHIAVRNGVSVRTLVKVNNLSSPDRIRVGQTLIIPSASSSSSSASSGSSSSSASSSGKVYTVASGDTLGGIALRFGVKQADLASVNNITNPHKIRIGQKLQIPGSTIVNATGVEGGDLSPARYGDYPSLPSAIVNVPIVATSSRPSKSGLTPTASRVTCSWRSRGTSRAGATTSSPTRVPKALVRSCLRLASGSPAT